MYLKRKIDSFLDAWKADAERRPLIVKGARQIGKTESIRQFSAGRYTSLIEINFALEPKYKTITEEGYEVESIVRHITLLDPSKEFLPGETLIFFDELQEFPEIA
ncbi:MAG: AAA family ATPase, partial [Oscillospiraceae bacterium]|nr:AAA family ATPase [Oscillospiraceae bacterium]